MMRNTSIRSSLLISTAMIAGFFLLCASIYAAGQASLSADRLVLEETESGLTITLEGPVQASYGGDRLLADSAVAILSDDFSSLDDAIERIELDGNVSYAGADGTSGTASGAIYYARQDRIVLSGSAVLTRGDITASASSVTYGIATSRLEMSGGVSISDGAITATSESAEYSLDERTGSLSESVEVMYRTGEVLFGSEETGEEIREVILRAEALYISAADGIVKTPEGPQGGRTEIVAGNFSLTADLLTFRVTEAGINVVEAQGDVSLTGPDLQYLHSDRLYLSTEDRVLRAEGSVEFSVRDQSGTAESIEVNFAAGWSIRLVGASIEGTVEEPLENEDNSTEAGEPSEE